MDASEPTLGNNLIRGNGGYELVLAALLLGFLGWWLDAKFGTQPFLMLFLGLLGFVGAGVSLYFRFKTSLANIDSETDAVKAPSFKAPSLKAQADA